MDSWTKEELDLKERMLAGEAVVIDLRNDGHPHLRDWATFTSKTYFKYNMP